MNRDEPRTEFEKAGSEEAGSTIFGEFWYLLRTTKKWWLLPILVAFLLLGVVILLSSSGAAPFIYTLF